MGGGESTQRATVIGGKDAAQGIINDELAAKSLPFNEQLAKMGNKPTSPFIKDAADLSEIKIDEKLSGLKAAVEVANAKFKKNNAARQGMPGVEIVSSEEQSNPVPTPPAEVLSETPEPVIPLEESVENAENTPEQAIQKAREVDPKTQETQVEESAHILSKEEISMLIETFKNEGVKYAEIGSTIVLPCSITNEKDNNKPILVAIHPEKGVLRLMILNNSVKPIIENDIRQRVDSVLEDENKIEKGIAEYNELKQPGQETKEGIDNLDNFRYWDGGSFRLLAIDPTPFKDNEEINTLIESGKKATTTYYEEIKRQEEELKLQQDQRALQRTALLDMIKKAPQN